MVFVECYICVSVYTDVETYLYTPGGEFSRIDMTWAHQALELLHEMG